MTQVLTIRAQISMDKIVCRKRDHRSRPRPERAADQYRTRRHGFHEPEHLNSSFANRKAISIAPEQVISQS
jgi:hypothetical protein